jgi:hypothetical protein
LEETVETRCRPAGYDLSIECAKMPSAIILADVAKIEDRELRESLTDKLANN